MVLHCAGRWGAPLPGISTRTAGRASGPNPPLPWLPMAPSPTRPPASARRTRRQRCQAATATARERGKKTRRRWRMDCHHWRRSWWGCPKRPGGHPRQEQHRERARSSRSGTSHRSGTLSRTSGGRTEGGEKRHTNRTRGGGVGIGGGRYGDQKKPRCTHAHRSASAGHRASLTEAIHQPSRNSTTNTCRYTATRKNTSNYNRNKNAPTALCYQQRRPPPPTLLPSSRTRRHTPPTDARPTPPRPAAGAGANPTQRQPEAGVQCRCVRAAGHRPHTRSARGDGQTGALSLSRVDRGRTRAHSLARRVGKERAGGTGNATTTSGGARREGARGHTMREVATRPRPGLLNRGSSTGWLRALTKYQSGCTSFLNITRIGTYLSLQAQ